MFCTNCGSQNAEGNRYCVRCGVALVTSEPSAPPSSQTTVVSEPTHQVWLCPKCDATVEEPLDVCWNCGTERGNAPLRDAAFAEETVSSATAVSAMRAAPPSTHSGRYPALRVIANFYRVLAILAG